ncbi:MAG: carboxypeptidase-like regulatory domain-containing protein, partial [bacterium]
MKKFISLLGAGLLCLLLFGAAYAQGVGSSGDIKGTVTDPKGAVVPNATVAAVGVETGLRRTAVTDDAGQYRITNLPPASYDISIDLHGFETAVRKSVAVTIGETVLADFQLSVSGVAGVVNVTSEAPVVDTERAGQANTIDQQYIRNLPINRRDYLTYTLLMPGV